MKHGTLLLLARAGDPMIATLRQLLPQHVVHADVCDLSQPGWRCVVGRPELATAAAAGRLLPADQIAAVLCRIQRIEAADLPHLHRDDREFAAAEMHAFLYAWLAQFGARLCNPPSSASLAGPAWLAMRWRWLAAESGIPALSAACTGATQSATVTVVGDHAFGTEAVLRRHALRLARTVSSTLLAVRFVKQSEWRLDYADPLPSLDALAAAHLLDWALASPAHATLAPAMAAR